MANGIFAKKVKNFDVPVIEPAEYINAVGGNIEEYNLDGKRYRSHTFTSSGTFGILEVSEVDPNRNQVDYLIIAGGGGGGSGGGGGAGGFRTTLTPTPSDVEPDEKVIVLARKTYFVTVGAGGGSQNQGSNSSVDFLSPIVSIGGGGSNTQAAISAGGSGGGAGYGAVNQNIPGGIGVLGQGRNGGHGRRDGTPGSTYDWIQSGGGGGAGGNGTSGTWGSSNGGSGLGSIIRTGVNEIRAGGGRGSDTDIYRNATLYGSNGAGLRGANTGSGGAAIFSAGGSGIVIIRYEIELEEEE